ncbi:hypothetical protein [Paraburkholderia sp. GAS348]|jgi:hypothetical protein|uniref:hypothetical protein n=1 Tax=Paraburkholderia sp. GAS348 TaxID=3035132 RepID=UPI003D2392BB
MTSINDSLDMLLPPSSVALKEKTRRFIQAYARERLVFGKRLGEHQGSMGKKILTSMEQDL